MPSSVPSRYTSAVAVTDQWLEDRIAYLQTLIEAIEAAMLAFATGGLQQSYRYDTGQQVVNVEREDGDVMWAKLQSIYNAYVMMCVRAGKNPVGLNARPGY